MTTNRRPEDDMTSFINRGRVTVLAGIAGLLLAGAPAAHAYSYLESAYGTPVVGQSARGLGMGGALTAVSDGAWSVVHNPAMLAHAKERMAVASLRGVHYDETRFVPLFDSFESFITETAVTENPERYLRLNGGVLWRPEAEGSPWAVAAGVYERYNFQFDFVDERRVADGRDTANRDKIKGTQTIRSASSIHSLSVGASYVEKVLSLGASLHHYFGDLSFSNATTPGFQVPANLREPEARDVLKRDVSGIGGTIGAAAHIDERVTLAASYELPVTLDVDWRRETLASGTTNVTDESGETRYPGRLALGLALTPRNSPRTLFAIDAARTFWDDDLEDSVLEDNPVIVLPGVRNTWEFRAGVEHTFYNDLPARFGFVYRELYALDEADEAGVAFGVGYKMESWDVGFGMDVMKRNSRQAAITPRTGDDPRTDRVTDSLLRGVVDVRYRF
jgi:long-subunit fatty acid transport protein